MTALTLLESLESRGIKLRLAEGEVHADFAPGALTDADREWIRRFRRDVVAVLNVRSLPTPMSPMPEPETWRTRVASWPEPWRSQWAQLTLDHLLAGFESDEAEWRALLAATRGSKPPRNDL